MGTALSCTEPPRAEDWNYVGDGRGSYLKIPTYTYVGVGSGNIELEEVPEISSAADASANSLICLGGLLLAGLLAFIAADHCGLIAPRASIPGLSAPAVPAITSPARYVCTAAEGELLVQQAWQVVDKDADGLASENELAACEAGRCDVALSPQEMLALRLASADGGGRLARDGFAAALRSVEGLEVASWAPERRAWCCSSAGLGCETSTLTPLVYKLSEAPVLHFDCSAGYANWEHSWSYIKKQWCCERFNRACESPTVVETSYFGSVSTSAMSSYVGSVSTSAMAVTTTAPTAAPYDCDSGGSEAAAAEWSPARRDWCCHVAGAGCAPPAPPPQTSPGPPAGRPDVEAEAVSWSSQGATAPSEATTAAPYDCNSGGFEAAAAEWSPARRDWCCRTAGVGCPTPAPSPPTPPSPPAPRPDAEAEAAPGRLRGGAAAAEGYDCDSGYPNFVVMWSTHQKAYCCRVYSRAC